MSEIRRKRPRCPVGANSQHAAFDAHGWGEEGEGVSYGGHSQFAIKNACGDGYNSSKFISRRSLLSLLALKNRKSSFKSLNYIAVACGSGANIFEFCTAYIKASKSNSICGTGIAASVTPSSFNAFIFAA